MPWGGTPWAGAPYSAIKQSREQLQGEGNGHVARDKRKQGRDRPTRVSVSPAAGLEGASKKSAWMHLQGLRQGIQLHQARLLQLQPPLLLLLQPLLLLPLLQPPLLLQLSQLFRGPPKQLRK